MQETRRARLQSVIREEMTLLISRELKDPRVPALTVTSVEVTPDAGQATIYISLAASGDAGPAHDVAVKECLKGLTSASGFLRRKLGPALNIRHIPSLIFREDRGYENVTRVNELLKKIEGEK